MLTTQPTTNGHITVDLGTPPLAPRRRPVNLSPWIACPVPGWEGLRVRFVVSRSKGEIDGTDGDVTRQAALLVGALDGWDFVEDVAGSGDPAAAPQRRRQLRSVRRGPAGLVVSGRLSRGLAGGD